MTCRPCQIVHHQYFISCQFCFNCLNSYLVYTNEKDQVSSKHKSQPFGEPHDKESLFPYNKSWSLAELVQVQLQNFYLLTTYPGHLLSYMTQQICFLTTSICHRQAIKYSLLMTRVELHISENQITKVVGAKLQLGTLALNPFM